MENKVSRILELYYSEHLKVIDISNILKVDKSYISRIIKTDEKYSTEKETRKKQEKKYKKS